MYEFFGTSYVSSVTGVVVVSDGHDKLFCTKMITIIDNIKNALGDTDNP